LSPSSKMTTGAWPHGGRPDRVHGVVDGIGSQIGAATGRLGVWTAIRAGNGGAQHLITIGPGRAGPGPAGTKEHDCLAAHAAPA
jgi:hypothetical protein